MDRRLLVAVVALLAIIGALSVISFVISTMRWLIIVAVLVAIGALVLKVVKGPPPDPEGRW